MRRDAWLFFSNRRRFSFSHTVQWVLVVVLVYIALAQLYYSLTSSQANNVLPDSSVVEDHNVIVPSQRPAPKKSVAVNPSDYVKGIGVLVFCAKRANALDNHLKQLFAQRPSTTQFPVYVSQDGNEAAVSDIIKKYMNENDNVHHLKHSTTITGKNKGYQLISAHYKWALDKVFENETAVIITEDDLDIAPDFFNYFARTRFLLENDETIWCVSAWNDNGGTKSIDVNAGNLLYRTDFFPGLGWMITKDVWSELSSDWPSIYWDDHLRRPEIRKDRVCIRPEISRTKHNNKLAGKGASNNQFKSYLEQIVLNSTPIDFSLISLERLIKTNYDPDYRAKISSAKNISINEFKAISKNNSFNSQISYRIDYHDPREFRALAAETGLMSDIRSGLARTAYYGIVPFFHKNARFFAVHNNTELNTPFETRKASETVYNVRWEQMARYLDFAAAFCKPSKWTGVCDPFSPEMKAWIKQKGYTKRVAGFSTMVVF